MAFFTRTILGKTPNMKIRAAYPRAQPGRGASGVRSILSKIDALSIPKHSYIQSFSTEPLFPATALALKFPRAC